MLDETTEERADSTENLKEYQERWDTLKAELSLIDPSKWGRIPTPEEIREAFKKKGTPDENSFLFEETPLGVVRQEYQYLIWAGKSQEEALEMAAMEGDVRQEIWREREEAERRARWEEVLNEINSGVRTIPERSFSLIAETRYNENWDQELLAMIAFLDNLLDDSATTENSGFWSSLEEDFVRSIGTGRPKQYQVVRAILNTIYSRLDTVISCKSPVSEVFVKTLYLNAEAARRDFKEIQAKLKMAFFNELNGFRAL